MKRSKTQKKKINKRRKGKRAIILPWVKRFGAVLGICVLTLWVGAWLWLSGGFVKMADITQQKIIEITADMGFTVDNILVEGRVNSDKEVLLALINIQKGDPIFSFNPGEAQKLIERIEWVKSAHVERRLPDTIYIDLKERKAVALWQQNKKLLLIDENGNVINTGRLSRFKDLMIVMGKDAPGKAHELIMNLAAEPLLMERVQSAKWIGDRRWDVTFKPGITVKLPEDDTGLALRRLAATQEEGGLLDKDITGIDLRNQGRIIVRTKPGAVQEYKAALKAGNNI